jgi:TetR/AcrR family transcriptional regulator
MTTKTTTRRPERPGRPIANPERDAREMLLTAATELFAEHGVGATSFATIAKRAHLTPAMVHYYFADRDQLLDAVVEERLYPLIVYVWGPVQAGTESADLIRGLVARFLSKIEQAPWVPSIWMREILNQGGQLRGRVLRRIPIEKVRTVGDAIRQEQTRKKANPDLDPLLTVFSMLGLVMLHMATVKVWAEIFQREPLDRETMARHITALLLDGLRGPGGAIRKKVKTK